MQQAMVAAEEMVAACKSRDIISRRAVPLNTADCTKLLVAQPLYVGSTAVRPDECGDRPLMARHKNGDYYWEGYAFKENYIEPVPDRIICPACEARVWRTKRKVCLGGGVKYVIFSCHCLTAFSSNSGSGFGHILQKWWEGLTAGD